MGNQGTATINVRQLVTANTQYNAVLPNTTYKFSFKCREEYDVFYAYITGQVAGAALNSTPTGNYGTLGGGTVKFEDGGLPAGQNVYFACATANANVVLEYWK